MPVVVVVPVVIIIPVMVAIMMMAEGKRDRKRQLNSSLALTGVMGHPLVNRVTAAAAAHELISGDDRVSTACVTDHAAGCFTSGMGGGDGSKKRERGKEGQNSFHWV